MFVNVYDNNILISLNYYMEACGNSIIILYHEIIK